MTGEHSKKDPGSTAGEPNEITAPSETARAKSAFLAHMRHELRTPLNAILGYSEMLLEDVQAEGNQEFVPDLNKINAAGKQLLALVSDILDPTKTEATRADLDLEKFAADIHHQLRTPLTGALGYCEMLLEDAADSDHQELIPDLTSIHQAAQRLLALINDIIQLARMEIGKLDFDLKATTAAPMIEDVVTTIREFSEEVDTPGRAQGALLVVDDNEFNRSLLSRRLERQGYSVAVAQHGREALAQLSERSFDLVLLDIMMPEMNGFQVLERMKAEAQWRDIPVIMISALDEIDSIAQCIKMGAADYLPKPFNSVLLKARIGACLEQKRLRDQEVAYLRNVALVTDAASAVENGDFQAQLLTPVAERNDALGQLARIFNRMAAEVYAREQRLKQQVEQLRVEIDEAKRARQVAAITETDYFQDLQKRAEQLRNRAGRTQVKKINHEGHEGHEV